MSNNRKIVFFDIDGTIYLYGRTVPEDTKTAIRQLRKNGHLAVLCTGRTKSMIFPEIYDVGFDGIIAGAGTYVEFGGNVLHEYNLPEDLTHEIMKTMKANRIMAILEGIDNMYFDLEYMPQEYIPVYRLYISKVGNHVKEINSSEKVIASKISGKVLADGGETVIYNTYGNTFNIVDHGDKYLEMIPGDYSKAAGIEKLIKELDIPLENTYAFGDSMNDYEMLKYVKYGVAMGNADENFKSQMNYVTEDFDKGGIYNALKRFELI